MDAQRQIVSVPIEVNVPLSAHLRDEDFKSEDIVFIETIYKKMALEVFRGFHNPSQRNVVVKRIFSEGLHEAAKKEANLLRELSHPNVIQCLGVVERPGYVDIIMEEGRSLRKEKSERHISIEEVNNIFLDICLGLSYIHSLGVIHFDLKCDNIIMVDGRAKLADFGSALRTETGSIRLKHARGTCPFMSPEVIRSEELSAATDIWSLGATLYELVTGFAPFQGESAAVAYAIGTQKVLPSLPASLQAPLSVSSLIGRCSNSDPSLRPSAQSLILG